MKLKGVKLSKKKTTTTINTVARVQNPTIIDQTTFKCIIFVVEENYNYFNRFFFYITIQKCKIANKIVS